MRAMCTASRCRRSGQQYSTLRAVAVPAEAADVAASEAEGPTALYQSTGVRLPPLWKLALIGRLQRLSGCWLHCFASSPVMGNCCAFLSQLANTHAGSAACLQVRKAVLLARLTDALQGW